MATRRRLNTAVEILLLFGLLFIGPTGAEAGLATKIVGGMQAEPGEFPGIVALVSGDSGDDWQDQYCGGSLIRADWVLTAAHCFTDDAGNLIASKNDSIAVIGRNDLNAGGGERISFRRIILHPAYVQATFDNDIALVELQFPSKTAGRMKVPALTRNATVAPPGTMATVAGWGYTGQRPADNSGDLDPALFPKLLRKVQVPVVSSQTCAPSDPTQNMICAGYPEGGKDSCQGDSGGPFMIPNSRGGWLQIGVVSSGPGCASPGFYGLYTKLENYALWISEHTCAGEFPVGPVLSVGFEGSLLMVGAEAVDNAQGYILYYAPYPDVSFIRHLDTGQQMTFQADLAGSDSMAFYLAWQAYNESCLSPFSNIDFFQW